MQTTAKRAWHRLRTLAPEYALYPLIVLIVLLVMGAFTGRFLTTDNPYGSYTIQACAWLEGHLDVNPNFTWLELAEYGGKFYVSFPLFPSYVMLPFAAIFGLDTPDHFINLAVTLLGIAYALRIYRRMTGSSHYAARYVLYLYLANGYLFIALQGWVWFLAQTMCFTLSLMAVDAAQRGRSGWALAWWACAVGCRPMAALYLPLLVYLLNQSGVRHSWKRQIANLLPAALIASSYMVLNYLRFGNPLEFGHTYLPEFQLAENGQFSLAYAWEHLQQLVRLPKYQGRGQPLAFDSYDCMAFYLITPMLVTFLCVYFYALIRRRRGNAFWLIGLPLMVGAHLMIIVCHKTLGGFQFGNRYLLDMLPWVYVAILALKPQSGRTSILNVPLMVMGFCINLLGAVGAYAGWL